MEYPKFKVTVSCMTYNQSKYITDAMNGFTMQQTSFPFVCTIVDDASTDGEQEVIRKYVENNFDFSEGSVAYHKETDYAHITYAQHKTNNNCYFAVLYLKENHYSKHKDKSPYLKDWRDGVEYMAICEGDDYWINIYKLQKQVNFLDNNSDYSLVFGKYHIFLQERAVSKTPKSNEYKGLVSLLRHNMIATASVLYRSEIQKKYSEEIGMREGWKMGDYPLWLFTAINSKIGYIPDVFSVYRVLSESASHSKEFDTIRNFIINVQEIRAFFINKYNLQHLISKEELIDDTNRSLFVHAYSMGYIEECKKYGRMVKKKSSIERLKYLLCYSPILYSILNKQKA